MTREQFGERVSKSKKQKEKRKEKIEKKKKKKVLDIVQRTESYLKCSPGAFRGWRAVHRDRQSS